MYFDVCVFFFFFFFFYLLEKTLYGKCKIEFISWREKLSEKKISKLTLCCQDVVYRQSGQVFIEIKSTSFSKV